MRSRLLWFLLLLIGVGLLALVLRHDQGTVGPLETGDFAALIYKIALLVFIGGAVLAMFQDRIAEAFQAAMFWVLDRAAAGDRLHLSPRPARRRRACARRAWCPDARRCAAARSKSRAGAAASSR